AVEQSWTRGMREAHGAEPDARVARLERLDGVGIDDRGWIEEQLGELRGVGERGLEVAIDAIELPHHARRLREVARSEEHGLDREAAAAPGRERDDQADRVGQHVQRRRYDVDPRV